MRQWDKSVALITGGGSGIGRATALSLASRGATLFICGRDSEKLHETVELHKAPVGSIHAISADIGDSQDVERLFSTIRQYADRLDLLINNAGVLGPRKALKDVSLEQWEKTLHINVTGTFLVSCGALALLRASSDNPLIINVSSSVGRKGRGLWGPYSVAKHGVEGLTDVLSDELHDDGICVVSLNPGGTATPMRKEAYPDENPATLPSANQVAETFVLLAESLALGQSGRKYNSRDITPYLAKKAIPPVDEWPFES